MTDDTTSLPPADAPVTAALESVAVTESPVPDANAAAPEIVPEPPKTPVQTSLLGDDPVVEPPVEEPPQDTPPAEDAPADGEPAEVPEGEGSQSDEPAPLPTYEAFKLPEGMTLDEEKLGAFTKEIGELERESGLPHDKFQTFAQKLVDQHATAINNTIIDLTEQYTGIWEKQTADWREAFENDPEIGGNRKDTTLKAAKSAIATFGGTAEQRQEISTLMNDTGLGNHPALIRLLAKVGEQLVEGKPLPATRPPTPAKSKIEKRYGNSA